ncbi:hypothetical protein SAMN04488037_103309 [Shimia marina]|uniref:C-type lysozyme inhibitor domain-containing protein n=1 Tax=Shimia marina TaxID=321267 RepID=A0A0P1ERS6_9RHOB|nr:hypothetical protein SHM7688_02510 [Shimia marina]SFD93386.1 hypothetical protein SAMN04488037_103309 [Shimia marina]
MTRAMRSSLLCVLALVPVIAHADCLPPETPALSCTLSNGGQLALCWTPQQARLAYDKAPGGPAEVVVPLGDVTGLTSSDWASSTLISVGGSYEVYLSGQIAGLNLIWDGGGSTSYTCATGSVNGSLAELNEAAIYAPSSKED